MQPNKGLRDLLPARSMLLRLSEPSPMARLKVRTEIAQMLARILRELPPTSSPVNLDPAPIHLRVL